MRDPATLSGDTLLVAAKDLRTCGLPHFERWLGEAGEVRSPLDTLRVLAAFRRGATLIATLARADGGDRRLLGKRLRALSECSAAGQFAPLAGCEEASEAVSAAGDVLAPRLARQVEQAVADTDWEILRSELPQFIRSRFRLYAQRAIRLGIGLIEPELVATTMVRGRLPPLREAPSECFWSPLVPQVSEVVLYGPLLFADDWVEESLVGVVEGEVLLASFAPVAMGSTGDSGQRPFTLLPRVVGAALSLLGERLGRALLQHVEDIQQEVALQADWLTALACDVVARPLGAEMQVIRRWQARLSVQEMRLATALMQSADTEIETFVKGPRASMRELDAF